MTTGALALADSGAAGVSALTSWFWGSARLSLVVIPAQAGIHPELRF